MLMPESSSTKNYLAKQDIFPESTEVVEFATRTGESVDVQMCSASLDHYYDCHCSLI